MCICVKLNPLFDNETTVYYVTQVLMHSININKICSNYILEFRNTNSHVLQVYLGVWVRIEIGIENMFVTLIVIVIIVFKRYSSTFCFMQGSCFICRDL